MAIKISNTTVIDDSRNLTNILDAAINGGDITTTSTTATVFNTTATTVNAFGAATALTIGATTGTATIRNASTVLTGDLTVNGGDIVLGGTGRIQGIDTVTDPTDAASKAYVDANAGATLTGTNVNAARKLVFTDESGLFFDNTGLGITFNPSTAELITDVVSANTFNGGNFSGNTVTANNFSGSDYSGTTSSFTSYVRVGNGTTGAPSFSFTSDTDTGFYWGGSSGLINVTTDSSTIFQFSSLGLFTNIPLDMGSQNISNLADPLSAQDAATKAYVDANAGASLTGTNANTTYKIPFTDESDLFFDNSGTSVSYNPGTGRLSAATMEPVLLYSGDGSAENPSISFSNDTDTGFFTGGSPNTLGVTLGGISRFSYTTSGMFTVLNLDFGNVGKITSLVNPSSPQDAATKSYVDTAVAGAGGGLTITNTAVNATHYITFTDQTSGTETQGLIDTANLQYNPSTNTLTTGTFVETSDERIKKNLEVIENATEKVRQINGYTFEKTTDEVEGIRHAGVIAQEIEKVLPEVVVRNDNTGLKTVAYGNMIALLIQALKEQDTRISALEERLEG